ncbi:DUF4411 family protein [bacterium]|nr:DUF4411 family protein [bacterium]
MVAIDASAIMHIWDNYPLDNFPPLWDWLSTQIGSGDIAIPKPAYDETTRKYPDCGTWLRSQAITILPLTTDILGFSAEIQALLGITDDQYHPHGVGENDILIIATAKLNDCELMTQEGVQPNLPRNLKKYKIPAVCDLPDVSVTPYNFTQFIKNSGEVFN